MIPAEFVYDSEESEELAQSSEVSDLHYMQMIGTNLRKYLQYRRMGDWYQVCADSMIHALQARPQACSDGHTPLFSPGSVPKCSATSRLRNKTTASSAGGWLSRLGKISPRP